MSDKKPAPYQPSGTIGALYRGTLAELLGDGGTLIQKLANKLDEYAVNIPIPGQSTTLADTDGPQFVDYMEAGPSNWRSGFAVLTFRDGRLLWPELVARVDDEHIQFRGEVIEV